MDADKIETFCRGHASAFQPAGVAHRFESKMSGHRGSVMHATRIADDRWYVAVLFVGSYLWQWLVYSTGGIDSRLLPMMMVLPALVAVLFMLIHREPFGEVGWGLKRAWLLPVAFVVPILVTLLALGLLSLTGWASWSNEVFRFGQGQVDVRKVTLILGKGIQSIGFFGVNLLLTMLLQSVPGSVLTLGEEIGWRGYLQKKLTDRHGPAKGVILLGLVWGYWHLPIVLMGYNSASGRFERCLSRLHDPAGLITPPPDCRDSDGRPGRSLGAG